MRNTLPPFVARAAPVSASVSEAIDNKGAHPGSHHKVGSPAAKSSSNSEDIGKTITPLQSEELPPMPTIISPSSLQHTTEWLSGAFLLDKPLGWTSADAVSYMRDKLWMKVGHAGTLDPLATGLLIVCFGKACKQIHRFQAQTKGYTGVLRLGQVTPSLDGETEVTLERPWQHLTDAQVSDAAASLTGDILQEPPMYSAVKSGGKRLYKMAREGMDTKDFAREARPCTVESFHVSREEGAQDVSFSVVCSKGTYIRTLAADLGEALGCGAYLVKLCRVSIGDYRLEDAWQVPEVGEALAQQRRAMGLRMKDNLPISSGPQPAPSMIAERLEVVRAERAAFFAKKAEEQALLGIVEPATPELPSLVRSRQKRKFRRQP